MWQLPLLCAGRSLDSAFASLPEKASLLPELTGNTPLSAQASQAPTCLSRSRLLEVALLLHVTI